MPRDEPHPRHFPITLPLAIKTYDIDAAGIVSNIVYIRWLEDLRIILLSSLVDWQAHLRDGFGPVLARTEIDYRRPLRLGDALIGHMWVEDIARSRWRVGAKFVVDDRAVASARQEGYWVNMRTVRPAPLPEPIRARWAALHTQETPPLPSKGRGGRGG